MTGQLPLRWRLFQTRDIRAALEWVDRGNIAVHISGLPFRKYEETAHLLAPDLVSLQRAARRVGCATKWIQKVRRRRL